jgi:hypothetical protein
MIMSDQMGEKELSKRFGELWAEAKHEIYRLQLLDTYLVDGEKEAFCGYKKGKAANCIKISGFEEWCSSIEGKSKQGVRIIDMEVVGLPLSEYKKFGISVALLSTNEKGQESFFVERKKVAKLISGFQDYWMFDSKVVIPMNYDKEGHFLGAGSLVVAQDRVDRYVKLREVLLGVAVPMAEFLRTNDVNLSCNSRCKNVIR